jgi:TRAP-type C4-dicarboxylate transport system permease small subunit
MESLIDSFFRVVKRILNFTGGTALSLMMFMTVADVVMRAAGRPILGTYEMVALLLAVVIGFTIPIVSLDRGHVYMEILLERLSKRNRALMNTFSRILCLILFVVIAYNLIMVGRELHASGEVSSTLKIPFYPIAYGVGVVCFIECLVFIFDIVKIWRGQYE